VRVATVGAYPVTLGWLIAILVLIVAVVLLILSQIDFRIGVFIAALALARLV